MKFKNLLVSSFILIGFMWLNSSAIAQSHSKKESSAKQSDNFLIKKIKSSFDTSTLFHQPQKNTVISQKNDAINSRVNALSIAGHDGVMFNPADSLRLFWSGDNHFPNLAQMLISGTFYLPSNTADVPVVDNPFAIKADSLSNYEWHSGSSVFKTTSKTVMFFDGQGNVISENTLETSNGIDWENESRMLYTYDAQTNIVSVVTQDWTGTVWQNDRKRAYTYGAQNNVTEIISFNWVNAGSSWKESSREIFGYEGSKVNSRIAQSWNSTENSWNNNGRTSVLYSGNNVSQIIDDNWSNSEWKPRWKNEYTYNGNNQLTTTQIHKWNNVDQEWNNLKKDLFTYDALGNNTSMITQNWETGTWKYDYKEEYTYASLNLAKVTTSDWDGTQFIEDARAVYSYNDYQQCTEATVETWNGSDWAPRLYSLQLKFYYEEFEDNTTGVGSIIDRNDFEIYPNPVSDILKVKLSNKEIQHIRIIDVTGRTVFESHKGFHASEANIPVSQMQNGVYILQVTSGNQTGTKSFVVRH